ncbi:hypothetical protein Tco_0999063, partial [Tanacetum coccineum]
TKAKAKENPFASAHAKDLGDSSEPFAENLNHSTVSSIAARGNKLSFLLFFYLFYNYLPYVRKIEETFKSQFWRKPLEKGSNWNM